MKNKIKIHFIFFLILEIVYILFSFIYSRDIEILGSVLWNLALTTILFSINLIKKRKNKWRLFVAICISSLLIVIGGLFIPPIGNEMINLVVLSAEGNTPFMRWFDLPIESTATRDFIYYFIFFYGALLYWYLVYRLSKKISKGVDL